jgi:hypothetical protein
MGIQEATGRAVARVTYVFASAGVERSPGKPAELLAVAKQRLAEEASRRRV